MTQRMNFNICVAFSAPKYVSPASPSKRSVAQSTISPANFEFKRTFFHSKTSSNSRTKLREFVTPVGSQNKKKKKKKKEGREKGKKKSCNLAKGSRTDQLPNHNSKTMSNKKLSKSNFHCHPHFRRSHLSPLLWRV